MTCPCCGNGRSGLRHHVPRRSVRLAGGFLPALALIFMPKCPACVAAYVALFTGVGVSMSTAWYLRTSAIALCVTSLLLLAVMTVRSLLPKGRTS